MKGAAAIAVTAASGVTVASIMPEVATTRLNYITLPSSAIGRTFTITNNSLMPLIIQPYGRDQILQYGESIVLTENMKRIG